MSMLLLNQFFWPDTAATAQLLSDAADYLSRDGENVTVICGNARYGGVTTEREPNVNIIRLQNSAFSRRFFGRMGSYLSFLGGAVWHGFRLETPSVVVTLTTPPLLSLVGMMIQKARGSRHVIWEMDLYPDVAVDLGVLRPNGILAKLFAWLADLPRHHADRIIVLGECMQDRLIRHGIPAHKIVIAENWADPQQLSARINEPCDKVSGESAPLSVLYSGNFGLVHDVDTISRVLLESDFPAGSVKFVFSGGGSRNAWLREFCEQHAPENVEFLPYCDRQELSRRLQSGDIGLVTQKAECLGSSVPSKAYGILAAGRPILFIGPKASTTARLIERHGCGWQVDNGDVAAVVKLLQHLSDHRQLVLDAGMRAHRAFLAHYQRSVGVARVARILSTEKREAVERVSATQAAAG